MREIEKAFRNAAKEITSDRKKKGSVSFEGQLDYEAFKLAENDTCVAVAQAAVQAIDREPELAISNGGLDANWLNVHGIPTVTLGSGQMQPHTVQEALCIPEFQDGCRIALTLATAAQLR